MTAERVVDKRKQRYDVYIGRPSKWGNPFRVGVHAPRGECIELYKDWIVRGDGRHLLRQLGELEGKVLGCFCAPEGGATSHDPLVCHGQILLKLLDHRRRKIREKKGIT